MNHAGRDLPRMVGIYPVVPVSGPVSNQGRRSLITWLIPGRVKLSSLFVSSCDITEPASKDM